jgi:predicted enzyme related to lactoylglutathione lyase
MKIPFKSKRQGASESATCLKVRIQYLTLTVSVMLILFLLAGCATMPSDVKLPPVAETSAAEIQEGRFVWIDLLTEDVVAAASFYSRLFGWRAALSEENGEYYLFSLDGKPVAGMTTIENKDTAASESLWLATISVSDVDQQMAAVNSQGGKILEGPLDAVGRGRMVLVSDAADAPVIFLATGGHGPAVMNAAPGQWLWTDLVTQDADRAQAFYKALFGYEVKTVEAGEEHRYVVLKRDGRAVAGLVELDWEGLEDNWLPYFRVADVDQSIAIARDLGGSLVLKSGDVAVLADPTGAAFGIQAHR